MKYLQLVSTICIDGRWFLPFQYYPLVTTVSMPMVEHTTRSGHLYESELESVDHYVIDVDSVPYTIPNMCGVPTDKEVPEELVNRYTLWDSIGSDNIKDYIKAAKEYLNIEIRHRPESAAWYRAQFPPAPQDTQKVSVTPTKETFYAQDQEDPV